jgi:hypothetical protein
MCVINDDFVRIVAFGASSAAAASDGVLAAAVAFLATAFVGASAVAFSFGFNGVSAGALVSFFFARGGHLDAVAVNLDANLLGLEPADLDASLSPGRA